MSDRNGTVDWDNRLGRLQDILVNAGLSRQQFFSQLMDSRRDVYDECGYPETSELTAERYKFLFDRDAIAGRVVELMPKECWRKFPWIYETSDSKAQSAFEKDLLALSESLRTEKSWFRSETCNPLCSVMRDADIMAGISGYAVILIGYDDVKRPEDMANPVDDNKARKVLYMQAYPESLARVDQYDADMSTRHFGMPLRYSITLNDPTVPSASIGMPISNVTVHWSRVVHIVSDELGTSKVRRPSRMQQVLNNILAAQKPYHASAEGYWKSCFLSIVFKTLAQLAGRTKINKEKLTEMMEDWENGLQRWFAVENLDVMPVSPAMIDPTPYIERHIDAICIKKEWPRSIFVGTDRADIRTAEDKEYWNGRCSGRNEAYTIPEVVCPVIDRLIAHRVLSEPQQYLVKWPDLGSNTAAAAADIALKKTSTLAAYVAGDVRQLIAPMDFLTRFMGMEDEEAEEVLKNALEQAQDAPEEQGTGPAQSGPFPNPRAA
jgi:hypothetical protein